MIVDWKKHCEKIYETKELSIECTEDRKHKVLQEIKYVVFLKDNMGFTWEQIFQEWKAIKNGRASIIGDDREWLDGEFRSNVMREYEVYKKNGGLPIKELEPIKIYQDEIDLINSQEAPKWCKEFWVALLINYKFVSQERKFVYKTKTVENWALRITGSGYDTNKLRESPWWKYFRNIFVTKVVKSKVAYQPSQWMEASDKGSVAVTLDSIEDYKQAFVLLEDIKCVCKKCGKEFQRKSMDKIEICPDCRSGMKTLECTTCGKIFVAGPKCQRTICEECYKQVRKKHNKIGIMRMLNEKQGNTQQ